MMPPTPATVWLAATLLVPGQLKPVSELATDLGAGDAVVRATAACALKEHGDRAIDALEPLIRLLGDATPVEAAVCRENWRSDDDRRTSPGELAAAALVVAGTRAVPPLVAALEHSSWIARRNAAWALGALDDPRGVAPVTTALRDREPGVRAQAAWALGAMDAEASAATSGLIGALTDGDDRVRRQAAWALGAIGDAATGTGVDAVEALSRALGDASKDVRQQSAWALGVIGDPRARVPLVDALRDPEAGVRRQAAWALGIIRR